MTKVGTGLGFHTVKTSFRTSEERFGSTEQADQFLFTTSNYESKNFKFPQQNRAKNV